MYSPPIEPSQYSDQELMFKTRPRRPKKWYQCWWGKILLAILGLILAIVVALVIYVVNFSYLIRTGQINPAEIFGQNNINQEFVNRPTLATDDDPSLGPRDAKIVIVEFSDFQCQFCAQFQPVLKRIISDYGEKIRFVYRDFPLVDVHAQALLAAMGANCAFEQGKFWEMHDKIFTNQDNLEESELKRYAIQIGLNSVQFGQCLAANKYLEEIEADFNEGITAGVSATPTFFINGVLVQGALSYDVLQKIIVSELNR